MATRTYHNEDKRLFVLIPRRVAMDFKRWKTVEASNMRMLPKVKQVYFLSIVLWQSHSSETCLDVRSSEAKTPHGIHNPKGR